MTTTHIYDAVRTPFGRAGGALAGIRPDDLAALVMRASVERAGLDPARVDDVIFGAANQAGEDNRNVARMGALLAGFPTTVTGATVNRLCASSVEAVIQGARAIEAGDADLILAGGVESMSRVPLGIAASVAGVIQRVTGLAFVLVLIGPIVLVYGAVEGVTLAVLLA